MAIFLRRSKTPTNYQGLDFHTRALQQSKVHLSWDEDEPQRLKTLRWKLNDDQKSLWQREAQNIKMGVNRACAIG